jgi:hypothetical protein
MSIISELDKPTREETKITPNYNNKIWGYLGGPWKTKNSKTND